MKVMDCKLIQNGERLTGICPLCGERTSHGALNGPRLCHNCHEDIFVYYPGLNDGGKCPPYRFTDVEYAFDEKYYEEMKTSR
jgi:hypothetical protein